MADISQVTLSNGSVVDIKDSAGREALASGLAGKVSIAQGVQNEGKILKVASSGLLELVNESSGSGTVTSVKMNNGTPIEPDSNGVVDLGTVITAHQDISSKLDASEKGANSGVASLDASGKVPASQLPSYVDDVLEYASLSDFPLTGENGKIYVAINTNKSYRWSGSAYIELSTTAVNDSDATLSFGTRTKIGDVAGTDLHVTMPSGIAWTGVTGRPSIVDNLTSTSTTDALSAAQGKALNDGTVKNNAIILNSTHDLNDYKGADKAGFYYLQNNVANAPASWIWMQVINGTGTVQICYSAIHCWHRAYTGSPLAWTDWVQMPRRDEIDGQVQSRKVLNDPDALSTSVAPGLYYALNASNVPTVSKYGYLDVTSAGNDLRIVRWQVYSSYDVYVNMQQASSTWSGWKKYATEVPSVVDNLTSTSTTDALSAKQGSILNRKKATTLTSSNVTSDTAILSLDPGVYQVADNNLNTSYIPEKWGTLVIDKSGVTYGEYTFVATSGNVYVRHANGVSSWHTSWIKLALDSEKVSKSGDTMTGTLTAQGFIGPLTGNVTGNCSGSAGSVPWSGVTNFPTASGSTKGGIKVGYTQNNKNYPVKMDGDYAYVTVPWTADGGNAATVNGKTVGTNVPANAVFTDTDQSTKFTVIKQISRASDFDPIQSGYFAGMTTKSGIDTNWWHILSMDWSGDDASTWISQLALPTATRNGIYYRTRHDSITNAWIKCLDANNYTDYTVTKTGTGASGTWGINVTGSANKSILGVLPRVGTGGNANDGVGTLNAFRIREYSGASSNMPESNWFHILETRGSDANYDTQLALGMTVNAVYYRNRNAGTWQAWKRLAFSSDISWDNISSKPVGCNYINDAVASITRSGTTYTATRLNSTTFTFTQKTSSISAWASGITVPANHAFILMNHRVHIQVWLPGTSGIDISFTLINSTSSSSYFKESTSNTIQFGAASTDTTYKITRSGNTFTIGSSDGSTTRQWTALYSGA